MPQVINGIGTWYYGRENLQHQYARCPACGIASPLRTYDTTRFLVVFLIPVLPLGRVRVHQECQNCNHHEPESWRAWNERRKQTFARLHAAYQANPRDPAVVQETLAACTSYRALAQLRNVAPDILRHFAGNPTIVAQVAAAYASMGELLLAADAYDQSLAYEDAPAIRELLAVVQLRMGEPDAAAESLAHILDAPRPENTPLLMLLARGYQTVGRHQDALRLFQRCVEIEPELAQDVHFAAGVDLSERLRTSGHPIADPAILTTGRIEPADLASRLAPKLPAILLLTLLAIYSLLSFTKAQTHSLWVINGLATPYELTLADKRYQLQPYQPKRLRLPEGVYTLKTNHPGIPLRELDTRRPFLLRPLLRTALVVNPDACAALLQEVAVYSDRATPKAPPPVIHTGHWHYELTGLDHVFQPFPKQVLLSESSIERRRGLFAAVERDQDFPLLLWDLAQIDQEAARRCARNRITTDAQDELAAEFLLHTDPLAPDVLAAADQNPALHQTIIYAAQSSERGRLIRDHYAALHTANPGLAEIALAYSQLQPPLARKRILEAFANHEQASVSLARLALACGDLDAARAYVQPGIDLPLDCELAGLRGNWHQLLSVPRQPTTFDAEIWRFQAKLALGQSVATAVEEAHAHLQHYEREHLEAQLHYLQGDSAAFARLLRQSDTWHLESAIAIDDWDAARALLPEASLESALLLTLLARQADQALLASEALAISRQLLSARPDLAGCIPLIVGERPLTALPEVCVSTRLAPLLLLFCREHNPALVDAINEHIQLLNRNHAYPHLSIQALLESE